MAIAVTYMIEAELSVWMVGCLKTRCTRDTVLTSMFERCSAIHVSCEPVADGLTNACLWTSCAHEMIACGAHTHGLR
jgi:hypothetical protein